MQNSQRNVIYGKGITLQCTLQLNKIRVTCLYFSMYIFENIFEKYITLTTCYKSYNLLRKQQQIIIEINLFGTKSSNISVCDASGTYASCPTGGLTSITTHSPQHACVPRYITPCMSAQALVSPLYKPGQHLYFVLIISCLFLVFFLSVYLTIIIQATSLRS